MAVAQFVLEDAQDVLYEEDVLRDGYSLKYWLKYLDAKRSAPASARNLLYERALKHLPGSYKLWRMYLTDRRAQVRDKCPVGRAHEDVVGVHERALVFMHKMPRMWLDYLEFLLRLPKPTHTRHAFDRALRALPLTQHDRVWPLYLRFVTGLGVTETAVRVYRRYLKFEPDGVEDFVDFLVAAGRKGEAAARLAELLNRDAFVSPRGQTRHTVWIRLCKLISENPAACAGKLRGEAIVRGGLREFVDEAGLIWTCLADFFIRQAQFERARDIYEEAVTSVMTVRDFSMVFDAYAQFEEALITDKMQAVQSLEHEVERGKDRDAEKQASADVAGAAGGGTGGVVPGAKKGRGASGAEGGAAGDTAERLAEAQLDLDMRLARLEKLTDRRPELLSSVLLRQNPHSVKEWLRRVDLFKDDPVRAAHTFAQAVKSVDAREATHGKLSTLWIRFAAFYETHGDPRQARQVLARAATVELRTADELAAVWLERIELELRHKDFARALELAREAVVPPPPAERSKKALEAGPVRNRLFRTTKLWAMRADLEESLGTFDSAKRAYDEMFALKVVTPQLVLNMAAFLEEQGYFEQSFQALERGVAVFDYPWALEIWRVYLVKFVERYGGTKLDRTRDLFEQALEKCPADTCAEIYRQYALFELDHGHARHAMAVLDRACDKVASGSRCDMFQLYIDKAAAVLGVPRVRGIYEKAIKALPDAEARVLCIDYAQMEAKLGEADRARALFTHAAQMYDPKTDPRIWQEWQDFEVEHGNEDTFRDMLRIRRAVQAQFAAVGGAAGVTAAAAGGNDGKAPPATGSATPESQEGFIPSTSWNGVHRGHVFKLGPHGLGYYADAYAIVHQGLDLPAHSAVAAAAGEDPQVGRRAQEQSHETEEVVDSVDVAIKQRPVPDAVFGSAAGKRGAGEEPLGARERFKRQK